MPRVTKKKAVLYSLGAVGVSALVWGTTYNLVEPDQFSMRVTMGVNSDGIKPSGLYFNVPFVQYTHSYQATQQRINYHAGSCWLIPLCDSTADHNILTAQVSLNYRVTKDTEKLLLHRWSMDGWQMADGYWLITYLMNDSANAILGKRNMVDNILRPKEFLDDFTQDFSQRLTQNNVPIEIDSIEMHGFTTFLRTRNVSYHIKKSDQPRVQ